MANLIDMKKVLQCIAVLSVSFSLQASSSFNRPDCEQIRAQTKGTVYENASHYWPLASPSSLVDVITCQDVSKIKGTISSVTSSDGLYGITTNGLGGAKLPTSNSDQTCLKSLTGCSNGLSIGFWINLLPSSKSHPSGFDVVMGTVDSVSPLTGLTLSDTYTYGLQVSIRTSNFTDTRILNIQRSIWNHVMITWKAGDNITYYVNSIMNSETNDTSREYVNRTIDTSAGFYLSYSTVAGQSSASFRDLAIWHQQIFEKNVKDIYQHTPGCQEIDPDIWMLSASSFADNYIPDSARFNSKTAWCEDPKEAGGYLQIQLPSVYSINAMILKPKEYGTKEYVNKFKVKYSSNEIKWTDYPKTLTGVESGDELKKIPFDNPSIVARFFRIYPTSGYRRRCARLRLCGVKQVLKISAAITTVNVTSMKKCSIKVNTKDHCPNNDGHNIVAIDAYTGAFEKAESFDTHKDDTAGATLEDFINNLANDTVIVVAIKTSGHRISKSGSKALYRIGAKSLSAPPANLPWILIGRKGSLQKWTREAFAESTGGSANIDLVIPLYTEVQPSHFWPLHKVDYVTPKHKYRHLFDIQGGMYMYHRSGTFTITMSCLRIYPSGTAYTKDNPNACIVRPGRCPGGVSVSVWLKVEHAELLHGEKDEQWDQIFYHKPRVILKSSSGGYIMIERKSYSAKVGITVILVDYATGQMTGQAMFDTSNDNTAENRFVHFLKSAPNGTIVLMNARSTSSLSSPVLIKALKAIGAKDPGHTLQECYLFAGYKGLDSMSWVREIKFRSESVIHYMNIPYFRPWAEETGMQDGRIRDWQLTSNPNTSLTETTPYNARLYSSNSGWNGGTTIGSYLQIVLKRATLIGGIKTQGSSTEPAWVKSYIISYSITDVMWFVIQDGSLNMEFVGNTDQHTPVRHTFRKPIYCRLFRITPTVFHTKMVMRIEIIKLNNAFMWLGNQHFQQQIVAELKALVYHDKTLQPSPRIVSSSVRDKHHSADKASLHNSKSVISSGCWCPDTDVNQFLLASLSERSLITSIGIQGCPSSNEWVTEFIFKYKDGDGPWHEYQENAAKKKFSGSFDKHTVVMNDINEPVYATAIGIYPKAWHRHPCLRFEVYGYPLQTACFGPLGVSTSLPDAQLSASSFKSTFKAKYGRLGAINNSWCVELQRQVYLQIDLGEASLVSGISSQGYDKGSWTKSFYLRYSLNGIAWNNHSRDDLLVVYEANKDRTSVVLNTINPYLEARYVRIYPLQGGNSSQEICLRVELYGCFKENPTYLLTGPLEISAANSSFITLSGSYRFCPQAINCPGCKRQLYMDVFGTTDCVVTEVLYDCQYHDFNTVFETPSVPSIYNIRVFDSIGKGCDTNIKRNVSGKIVGRVLVKAYESTSCLDVLLKGNRLNGIYNIRPENPAKDSMIPVYCDQMRHGGGWTVIQKRINGTVDFYKTWKEYKTGFGSLEGEFWLGNDVIHRLTSSPVELLIEMETFAGVYYYAKYDTFQIENEAAKYKLLVSGYSGTAGDSLSTHNKTKFSTKDQDNDLHKNNCPELHHSAWWYTNCKDSDLNGAYVPQEGGTKFKGIKWEALLDPLKNLKSVEMKIRPKQGRTIKCFDWGCFYLIKGKFKYNTARQKCWSMGGDLATIKNAEENKAIKDMVVASGLALSLIGINDMINEGQFEGPDGSIVDTYTNWEKSNHGNRDCYLIDTNGKWKTGHCWSEHPYGCICQRGFMCHKSSCYYINGSALVTRDIARLACEHHGQRLMKIPGTSKSEFIKKYVMPNPGIDLWIGLNDEVQEGRFLWIDKSNLTASYANWDSTQPSNSNGDEDCVVLAPNGKWQTKECSQNAGQVCQKQIAQSCQELLKLGEMKSGVYLLYTFEGGYNRPMNVYCDQENDGGGWEILLRRQDGSVTFHDKLWDQFEYGFGNLDQEFWLGLKKFYRLGNGELMLRINSSDGTSKYQLYGYGYINKSPYYELKIARYREGTLQSYLPRSNDMRFSTVDRDNDLDPNRTCTDIFGPGWLWTYMRNKPNNCFNAHYNIFGPYSPNAIGNASNLYYIGFDRPITYIEMKTRRYKGFQRAAFTTFHPMEPQTTRGLSLFYAPHEFTLHMMLPNKALTLSVSPGYGWSHYTFTWNHHHGLRSYENGILAFQTRIFRNVSSSFRNNLLFGLGDLYIRDTMYIFMSRLKTWNKELTVIEVQRDFDQENFNLEGYRSSPMTRWYHQASKTFHWILNSNGTASNETGPMFDHTYSGFPQGSYYYLESSYPRVKDETASLFSPIFFPNHKCFYFWYHMRGKNMGKLAVSILLKSRTPYQTKVEDHTEVLWEQQGDLGNQWQQAVISIDVAESFKLNITGTVGSTYLSDMAIDDLRISTSSCPNISSCNPKCQDGFACVQSKGICDCKGMKHVNSTCHYILGQSVFSDTAYHWPLDNPTNITNTRGSIHGFTVGNVVAVRGAINTALATDGITGQITLADLKSSCILSAPSCSSGFTLTFWLKFGENDNKQRRVFVSVGYDKKMSRGLQFLQDYSVIDSTHLIIYATIDKTSCVIGFEVQHSIWSIVTLSWGKANGFTLYHNGENVTNFLVHKCSSVISVFPTNTMLSTGFDGNLPALTLDDVALWYRELKVDEIVKIFKFFTVPEKTITLSVKFPMETFKEKMHDRESVEFKSFADKILQNAQAIYTGNKHFQGTHIDDLSDGCVIARLSLLFDEITNTELELLGVALCDKQHFGQMQAKLADNIYIVTKNVLGITTRNIYLCETCDGCNLQAVSCLAGSRNSFQGF